MLFKSKISIQTFCMAIATSKTSLEKQIDNLAYYGLELRFNGGKYANGSEAEDKIITRSGLINGTNFVK